MKLTRAAILVSRGMEVLQAAPAAYPYRSAAEGFRDVKVYRYVGPRRIADRAPSEPAGIPIHSPADVRAWVRSSGQELAAGSVIATFVVDAGGVLRVADRRSEHVACAGGQPVRSAGEVTFAIGRAVEVAAVSNQSTGYCPEPVSWPAVAAALVAAGLEPPAGFSLACEFRRCVACGSLTLVKGGVFECGMCGADLPAAYNCQAPDGEPGAAADGGS